MDRSIVMPNLPGAGFISTLSRAYKDLTDTFLQQWFYDLYLAHQLDPPYLFVSPKGRIDLRRAMESLQARRYLGATGQTIDDLTSRYPNQVTGTMLYVVVLPTLPETLLLVGNEPWQIDVDRSRVVAVWPEAVQARISW